MNSKRVACGLAFLANHANLSCIAIYSVMRGLCLLNLDGCRNNGKHFFIMQTRCTLGSVNLRHCEIAKSSFPFEHVCKQYGELEIALHATVMKMFSQCFCSKSYCTQVFPLMFSQCLCSKSHCTRVFPGGVSGCKFGSFQIPGCFNRSNIAPGTETDNDNSLNIKVAISNIASLKSFTKAETIQTFHHE